MRKIFVSELPIGREVTTYFAVQDSSLRTSKSGDGYVKAKLSDRTGNIDSIQFSGEDFSQYAIGEVVKVRAKVEGTQKSKQLVIFQVRRSRPEEIEEKDYVPSSSRKKEDMATELDGLIASLADEDLRKLLEGMLGKAGPLREKFLRAPAALLYHHAWIGGVAEHSLAMSRLADAMAKERPSLNRDILVVGTILHDVGKVEANEAKTSIYKTDAGRLCEHIILGACLVDRFAREAGIPDEKRQTVMHLVSSHHGTMEQGSPTVPMTPEAVVLHYIDEMDAKLRALESLMETGLTGWAQARILKSDAYLPRH